MEHQHGNCPSHRLRRGQAASPAHHLVTSCPSTTSCPSVTSCPWLNTAQGAAQPVSPLSLKPALLLNRALVEQQCLPTAGMCPPRLLQTHATSFPSPHSSLCFFSSQTSEVIFLPNSISHFQHHTRKPNRPIYAALNAPATLRHSNSRSLRQG